jgi:hypothetical protein
MVRKDLAEEEPVLGRAQGKAFQKKEQQMKDPC